MAKVQPPPPAAWRRVYLDLPAALVDKLKERAKTAGKPVNRYVATLVEKDLAKADRASN